FGGGRITTDAVLSDLSPSGIFEGEVRFAEDTGTEPGEQIVRLDGSGWLADGFVEGQWVRIIDLDNPENSVEVKIELIRGDNDTFDEKLQVTERTALPTWLTDRARDNVRVVRIAPEATFTPSDYFVQQSVVLEADPYFDTPITREGVKIFPVQEHLLSNLKGPLQVEGGPTEADRSLVNGLKLPGEADDYLFAIGQQPPESQQIDVLNIFNDGSVQNTSGVMTETTLTGFGLAGDLDFGAQADGVFGENSTVPGGISWGKISFGPDGFATNEGVSTIEVVNLMLGQGNDALTIEGTLYPARPVETTGEFRGGPSRDGTGGTIRGDDVDWFALGFLPGQTVEIDGVDGTFTITEIRDQSTPEGRDPNDDSILVLEGAGLPRLNGLLTIAAFDPLVESSGRFDVVATSGGTFVTRNDEGSWEDDNFLVGHLVRVQGQGFDQSLRLIDIVDGGQTLVLEGGTLESEARAELHLSVQGPHGGLTVVHGGGNAPLELCLDLFAANGEGDGSDVVATDTGNSVIRPDRDRRRYAVRAGGQ
ncbi:MAG: hypothetical protein AAGL98_07165, partial [Planctomycetota bacterium]